MLTALVPQLNAQNIQTVVDVAKSLQIVADRGMFRSAVLNLVLNALDAMPNGGRLEIALDSVVARSPDRAIPGLKSIRGWAEHRYPPGIAACRTGR